MPPSLVEVFGRKQEINYPPVAVPSEDLPEPYNNITSIPTTFFTDSNGVIVSVCNGYLSFEELKKHSSENVIYTKNISCVSKGVSEATFPISWFAL